MHKIVELTMLVQIAATVRILEALMHLRGVFPPHHAVPLLLVLDWNFILSLPDLAVRILAV